MYYAKEEIWVDFFEKNNGYFVTIKNDSTNACKLKRDLIERYMVCPSLEFNKYVRICT